MKKYCTVTPVIFILLLTTILFVSVTSTTKDQHSHSHSSSHSSLSKKVQELAPNFYARNQNGKNSGINSVYKKKDIAIDAIKKAIARSSSPVDETETAIKQSVPDFLRAVFDDEAVCKTALSDALVNFAIEGDQRYVLAQDIYLVLKAILTASVLGGDTHLAYLQDQIGDSGLIEGDVENILLFTKQEKSKTSVKHLGTKRSKDSIDLKFSQDLRDSALKLNETLGNILKPFLDGKKVLSESISVYLKRVILNSLDMFTVESIPDAEAHKAYIKEFSRMGDAVHYKMGERSESNLKIDHLATAITGTVAWFTGGFGIPFGLVPYAFLRHQKNKFAGEVSHFKSVAMQLVIESSLLSNCVYSGDPTQHLLQFLLTLGSSLATVTRHWGSLQLAKKYSGGSNSEDSEYQQLRLIMDNSGLDTNAIGNPVSDSQMIKVFAYSDDSSKRQVMTLRNNEEGLVINYSELDTSITKDWVIQSEQIEFVNFVGNPRSPAVLDGLSKCKSNNDVSCLSNVVPTMFQVQLQLTKNSHVVMPLNFPLDAPGSIISLRFLVSERSDKNKLYTRGEMKQHWNSLKSFFTSFTSSYSQVKDEDKDSVKDGGIVISSWKNNNVNSYLPGIV